jgi:hypothetical protein
MCPILQGTPTVGSGAYRHRRFVMKDRQKLPRPLEVSSPLALFALLSLRTRPVILAIAPTRRALERRPPACTTSVGSDWGSVSSFSDVLKELGPRGKDCLADGAALSKERSGQRLILKRS